MHHKTIVILYCILYCILCILCIEILYCILCIFEIKHASKNTVRCNPHALPTAAQNISSPCIPAHNPPSRVPGTLNREQAGTDEQICKAHQRTWESEHACPAGQGRRCRRRPPQRARRHRPRRHPGLLLSVQLRRCHAGACQTATLVRQDPHMARSVASQSKRH